MPKIALVGTGPAGLGFLKGFLEGGIENSKGEFEQKFATLAEEEAKNLEIHVFEKSLLMGAGLPYDESMTDPEHLLNIATNTSYINRFYQPKFHEWAKENQDKIKEKFQRIYDQRLAEKIEKFPNKKEELEEHYKKIWQNIEKRYLNLENGLNFHPRIIYGIYGMEIFENFIEKLREKGFNIVLHPDTEVTFLNDSLNLGFEQEGVETKSIKFDQVVIASGKWQNPGRIESDRYLAEISPAEEMREKIEKMIAEEKAKGNKKIRIAVEGASLSAVDVVKTIFRDGVATEEEAKQELEEESKSQRNKKLKFTSLNLDDVEITVDVVSREGIFRGIRANYGFLAKEDLPENCQLTQKKIDELSKDENGKIHLWQVVSLAISSIENSYRFFGEEKKANQAAEINNFIIENKDNYAAITERLLALRNKDSFQQLADI
jgi:hypothetical protein